MKAALGDDDIREIAALARLSLSDSDIPRLRRELTSIIDYMGILAEVDVEGISPMTHPNPIDLPLRDDTTQASIPAETAVSAAAQRDGTSFKVPSILK